MKKMRLIITKTQHKIGIILALTTLLTASLGYLPKVFATTYMTHASVIEYNMEVGGTSQVVVAFTAGASDVAGSLTVNFNGWTGSSAGIVNNTQTINTTGCTALTGASNALPTSGTLTAAGATSIVTVSSVGALTSGQSYCFNLTSASAVTNPTSAGQSTVTITDASDTSTLAIDVISASPGDAVTVSATVPPSFTLALGGSTDAFTANLSSSVYEITSGVTATINTNAASGWGLWAEDSNNPSGLHSASEAHTIASVATGSNSNFITDENSEAYGLGVTTANATTNYADAGGHTGGGLSYNTFNEIASSASPASNATATIKELADISSTTPAAQDYSDVITVVGAGSF